MFSISFLCRESKAGKKGLSPIELSIVMDGERTYMLLPMKCTPSEYRKLSSQKKGNWLRAFCDAWSVKVQTAVSEMYTKGLVVSPVKIKEYLRGEYTDVYTVGMLVSEYLGILKKRVDVGDLTMGNYAKYEKVSERLTARVGARESVERIDNSAVMDILYALKAEYSEATVSNYYTKLKAVVRFAMDKGKLSVNPFAGIKVSKGEKEAVIISSSEYGRIREKAISIPRLEKVRDLFVFACSSGISFCDVVKLKRDDFSLVDGRWVVEKERQKTGIKFYSVILDDGVSVLEKYGWDLSCLFMSNQKTNSYLKEIGDICGVCSCDLHYHIARHYYITSLIRMGVPVSVVQKCAGHSNIRMTQKYTHLVASDIVSAVSGRI